MISRVLAVLASAYIASFLKSKLQCRYYLGYFFPTLKIRKLRMRNNLCEVTEESGISYLCFSCRIAFPKNLTFQTDSIQHREPGNASMCGLLEGEELWWHTQLTPPFIAEKTEVHKREAEHGWKSHSDVWAFPIQCQVQSSCGTSRDNQRLCCLKLCREFIFKSGKHIYPHLS